MDCTPAGPSQSPGRHRSWSSPASCTALPLTSRLQGSTASPGAQESPGHHRLLETKAPEHPCLLGSSRESTAVSWRATGLHTPPSLDRHCILDTAASWTPQSPEQSCLLEHRSLLHTTFSYSKCLLNTTVSEHHRLLECHSLLDTPNSRSDINRRLLTPWFMTTTISRSVAVPWTPPSPQHRSPLDTTAA